jgi:hypothetical protein
VDGAVYAQPLWVANLSLSGVSHNVVFIATQHDSLYAFDADANLCVQLWMVSLIDTNHGGTSGCHAAHEDSHGKYLFAVSFRNHVWWAIWQAADRQVNGAHCLIQGSRKLA